MADLLINGKKHEGVTEVQIPLADGSANAVFVPESDGGSAEIMFGTFTLEEPSLSVTFECPSDFTHLAYWQATPTFYTGHRTIFGRLEVNEEEVLGVGSNAGGSAWGSPVTNGDYVTVTRNDDGTITLTSDDATTSGYFAATTYNWFAFNSSPLA